MGTVGQPMQSYQFFSKLFDFLDFTVPGHKNIEQYIHTIFNGENIANYLKQMLLYFQLKFLHSFKIFVEYPIVSSFQ